MDLELNLNVNVDVNLEMDKESSSDSEVKWIGGLLKSCLCLVGLSSEAFVVS